MTGGGKETSGAIAPLSGAGSCLESGGNGASGVNAPLCGAGRRLEGSEEKQVMENAPPDRRWRRNKS